jgi:hypothetical protein
MMYWCVVAAQHQQHESSPPKACWSCTVGNTVPVHKKRRERMYTESNKPGMLTARRSLYSDGSPSMMLLSVYADAFPPSRLEPNASVRLDSNSSSSSYSGRMSRLMLMRPTLLLLLLLLLRSLWLYPKWEKV